MNRGRVLGQGGTCVLQSLAEQRTPTERESLVGRRNVAMEAEQSLPVGRGPAHRGAKKRRRAKDAIGDERQGTTGSLRDRPVRHQLGGMFGAGSGNVPRPDAFLGNARSDVACVVRVWTP